MSGKSRFVTFVGTMPFLGRHDVRRDMREGIRASRLGDRVGQLACAQSITSLAKLNGRHFRYSLLDTGIFCALAAVHDSTLYACEAGVAGVVGLGFGAASLAQRILARQLRERPTAPPSSEPVRSVEPLAASRPSLLEAVVLTVGTLGATAMTLQGIATVGYDLVRAVLDSAP